MQHVIRDFHSLTSLTTRRPESVRYLTTLAGNGLSTVCQGQMIMKRHAKVSGFPQELTQNEWLISREATTENTAGNCNVAPQV